MICFLQSNVYKILLCCSACCCSFPPLYNTPLCECTKAYFSFLLPVFGLFQFCAFMNKSLCYYEYSCMCLPVDTRKNFYRLYAQEWNYWILRWTISTFQDNALLFIFQSTRLLSVSQLLFTNSGPFSQTISLT